MISFGRGTMNCCIVQKYWESTVELIMIGVCLSSKSRIVN